MKNSDIVLLRGCPKCGSAFFVSTRSGKKKVFQVDEQGQMHAVHPEQEAADALPIQPEHIYCGACSWQGAMADLVPSHM